VVRSIPSGRSCILFGREVQNFHIHPYSDDHLFLAGLFWRDIRPSSHIDRHEELLTLIKRYKTWSCYDPRDKIYALLGLARDCKDGSGLIPDYSKDKAVMLWDVIALCKPPIGQLIDVAGMLRSSLWLGNRNLRYCSNWGTNNSQLYKERGGHHCRNRGL
jgi:hypothetical protein